MVAVNKGEIKSEAFNIKVVIFPFVFKFFVVMNKYKTFYIN